MQMSLSNNAVLLLLTILFNASLTDAVTYCTYRGCWTDLGWTCSSICYRSYYGYYCCDDWYGSAWAVVLWVFLSLILIACCIWCCVAAASTPPAGVVYAEPVEVYKVKKSTSPVVVNQPAKTSATAGTSQVMQAGTYNTQPVAAPVQGQPISHQMQTELSSAPVAPAQGQPPAQNITYTGPVYQGSVAPSSTHYPDIAPPVDRV